MTDESQYRALKEAGCQMGNLETSGLSMKVIQAPLDTTGEFKTTISNKYHLLKTRFMVLKGKMDLPPLISDKTSMEMGFVAIDKEGRLNGTDSKSANIAKSKMNSQTVSRVSERSKMARQNNQ